MKMNRLVMHHTGGGYTPSHVDLKAYHRVTSSVGKVYHGDFPIEANAPGKKLVSGHYAAHCKNLNTGAIGASVAAMTRAQWAKPYSSCPPTEIQMDAFLKDVATLLLEHDIQPERKFCLSHAEVEITLGVKQANKWDFDYDPYRDLLDRDPVEIGDMLRNRISGLMQDLHKHVQPISPVTRPVNRPTLKQGHRGTHVGYLQQLLSLVVDDIFGPKTRTAVVNFQKKHELLPDGIVGQMTWLALTS